MRSWLVPQTLFAMGSAAASGRQSVKSLLIKVDISLPIADSQVATLYFE